MSENITIDVSRWNETEKFAVIRQIDADVEDKVDRLAFQEAAQLIDLPQVIADHGFVFITLICQATDEGKNEIWENEGGAYITLMLPHDFVLNHPPTEVTELFLSTYQAFIYEVKDVPPIPTLEAK